MNWYNSATVLVLTRLFTNGY